MPPDRSKALTREEITAILTGDAPLRQRVLWHLLYETAARVEDVLAWQARTDPGARGRR